MAKLSHLPYATQVFLLFTLYCITGKIGLAIVPVSGFATLAWPPTGISLAALLLFGYRLWPGIALGALAVNLTAGASFFMAIGIAIGNSTEALFGTFILRRFFKIHNSLDRIKDALALVFVGVFLSSPISATIGTLSLWAGNVIDTSTLAATWLAWWVGDGLSDVLFTPFLLIWGAIPLKNIQISARDVLEVTLLFLTLAITSKIVFSDIFMAVPGNYPLAYLTFPFLIWAALRFGERGTVTASMMISTFAIWGSYKTLSAYPPDMVVAHLYFTQSYEGATALTAVILASAVAARKNAEKELFRAYIELEHRVMERTAKLRSSEEELQKHLSVLTAITESTSDPIFIKDLKGRYLMLNSVTARLFNRPMDQIIGKDDSHFFPPEIADKIKAKDRSVIESGQAHTFEEELLFKGQRLIFSTNKTPYRDTQGKIIGVIGITREITERKRSEQALQESKNELQRANSLLQATLESTADGILVVDQEGRIVSFNQRFVDLWHIPRSVLELKQDDRALNTVLDQLKDPTGFLKKVQALYANPEVESIDLIEFKDGRIFERYSQLQRMNHETIGRVWSFRDITARISIENEKTESLYREQRARAHAEEAMRMRDELIAMVSHDLKNPLAGILSGTQLIQRSKWVDERSKRLLMLIRRSVEQMNRLIQDLLDSQKIEGKCFNIQNGLGIHEVAPLVQECIDAQQILASEKDLQLEISLPNNLPKINVNAERIRQVFQNLIGNAIKFTPVGGVIQLKAEEIHSNILFSIKDSGPGIEESFLPHLFERFSRAKSTSKEGTGLGLSIAKGIVEAHGGKIWVKSKLGEGCIFFFILPTKEREDS